MLKKFKNIKLFIYLLAAFVLPKLVLAANPALDKLNNVAVGTGPYAAQTDANTLTGLIGQIISIGLGLIGVIFLVLMIYSGYNWMTAQGEEEKVTKAKDTIIRALIGIIIVVGSYAIWRFLFVRLFF